MKKIERVIAIVMILLQKNKVSASEFSQLFGVSSRTIQRDIETLIYANIPIYAILGSDGGYALMEDYKYDKRLLNQKDIENMVTALHGFEALAQNPEIQLTLQKIKSMHHHHITPKVDISFYKWRGRQESVEILTFLDTAILHCHMLAFDYIDRKGEHSKRKVEPYKVYYREQYWYLKGYDLQRKDFRLFKFSRMSNLEEKGRFNPRTSEKILKEISEGSMTEEHLVKVKLAVNSAVLDQFLERYGQDALIKSNNKDHLMCIELPKNDYAYQFLSGFGNKIKILEPHAFISEYVAFLQNALNTYK